MEHTIWVIVTLAFGALMFFLGQRSVRVIGTRTETMQASDRLSVQRVAPDPTGAKIFEPYHEADPHAAVAKKPSLVAPPTFRDEVAKWRQEEGKD